MKDILISLLILLVIMVIRGSYGIKDEVSRVPYYAMDFDSMEERVNPDEVIFSETYL